MTASSTPARATVANAPWSSSVLVSRPAWVDPPRRQRHHEVAEDVAHDLVAGHAPVEVSVVSPGTPLPRPPDLSVVIAVRNDLERLVDCLAALASATQDQVVQVVVVDGGSTDRTTSTLLIDFPYVTLVRTATDLGPAWSTDIGLSRCQAPVMLLCDPGARPTPEALAALRRHLVAHPRCALAAAPLDDEAGRPLPGPAPRPTLRHLLVEESGLARLWPDNPWRRRLPLHALGGVVDGTPPLGLLALRRAALDEVGPLDTDLPWHEHYLDWVRRLAKSGWETRVIDGPRVTQVTVGGYGTDDGWRRHRDRIRYARKHHGAWGVRCASVSLWSWALVEAGARIAGRGAPLERGIFGAFEALGRARHVRAMA